MAGWNTYLVRAKNGVRKKPACVSGPPSTSCTLIMHKIWSYLLFPPPTYFSRICWICNYISTYSNYIPTTISHIHIPVCHGIPNYPCPCALLVIANDPMDCINQSVSAPFRGSPCGGTGSPFGIANYFL